MAIRRRTDRSRDRRAAGDGTSCGARRRDRRRAGRARLCAGDGGAERTRRRHLVGIDRDACPRMGASLWAGPRTLRLRPRRVVGGGGEAAGRGGLGARRSVEKRRLYLADRRRAVGRLHRVAPAGAGRGRPRDALPARRCAGGTRVAYRGVGRLDDLARRLAPVGGRRLRRRGARLPALARRTDPVAGKCARRTLGA